MKGVRFALISLVIVASFSAATVAFAYSETTTTANHNISPSDCASCHGLGDVSVDATRTGPHLGYITSSRSCAGCHIVHAAPSPGSLLLPGQTITETCELCHDGTGGQGVYGTLAARGLSVQAAHRTETTTVVPGGSESTGGTSTVVFGGEGTTLSCGDCHQPHGVDLVEPFTSDRRRNTSDTVGFKSSELLRRKPTGATTETPVYGSDWCGACHKGRMSGVHTVVNHPVDSSATVGSAAFTYENLQRTTGVNSALTETGTLGGENLGYVMPWPRTPGQASHKPVCQQCHEDGRNVGDATSGLIDSSEDFTVTSADGTQTTDNPRFQVFPHESPNQFLLIESSDDLCTNCHPPVR